MNKEVFNALTALVGVGEGGSILNMAWYSIAISQFKLSTKECVELYSKYGNIFTDSILSKSSIIGDGNSYYSTDIVISEEDEIIVSFTASPYINSDKAYFVLGAGNAKWSDGLSIVYSSNNSSNLSFGGYECEAPSFIDGSKYIAILNKSKIQLYKDGEQLYENNNVSIKNFSDLSINIFGFNRKNMGSTFNTRFLFNGKIHGIIIRRNGVLHNVLFPTLHTNVPAFMDVIQKKYIEQNGGTGSFTYSLE